MGKTFKYNEALNMVTAVSTSYVTRGEIIEYFEKKFDKNKAFTGDELKQIVGEVVKGKKRISQTMDQIGLPQANVDAKRRYYSSYMIRDEENGDNYDGNGYNGGNGYNDDDGYGDR